MKDNWLAKIEEQVEDVIAGIGRKPLQELGFVMSELVENLGEHAKHARQELVTSPLFKKLPSQQVLRILAVAIGADGAREAYQGGAIDNAIAAKVDVEDIPSATAKSISFGDFFLRRLTAAKAALSDETERMFKEEDEQARLAMEYLAEKAYQRFIAPYVEGELAN